VGEGGPAAFRVAAIGTGPIAYQWSRNGSPIADGTNAIYTIASTTLGDSGAVFSSAASNFVNNTPYTAVSSNATLTVLSLGQALSIATVSRATPAIRWAALLARCRGGCH